MKIMLIYAMSRKQRPVLIAGPTASGKSALALALAERDGGVVINADASQVYACWRILTARPDAADLARAPHRLYGHVACAAGYSVGHWLRDVTAAIAEAERAGQRPIVVGGTGLYFHALTAASRASRRSRRRSARRVRRRMDLAADARRRSTPRPPARIDLQQPDARAAGLGGARGHRARAGAAGRRETEAPVMPADTAVAHRARNRERFT